jgi:lipoteichoic acid synthase
MKNLVSLRIRPFIIFSIILVLKCVVAWYVVFHDRAEWRILITELPFFMIVFTLIEWFASKRKILYYIFANFMITLIYFAVLMYYKYYGVIATYHALQQVEKVTRVGESTYSLISPHYLIVFADVAIFLFFMFRPAYIERWKERGKARIHRKVLIIISVVSLVLCLINIWPNHVSMNEIKKANSMGILNYEVYRMFADTTDVEELVDPTEITQQEINALKGDESSVIPQYHGADKGKNLIVVQMESLQNFLVGLTLDGMEVTPNLNRLAKDASYFQHFFTNAGQGTTSDAEFSVNTSFYVPKNEPATSSDYMNKALPSLPRLLDANGYYSVTYHTNSVDFWNRQSLYEALGFDRYYDMNFFGTDDYIAFGSSDEVLYDKVIPELVKLDSLNQPFYSMILSMTAHHPFHLPKEKQRMVLPERYQGTLIGNYFLAQHYADYALGLFIERLKSSGLWDNSVVVIYGDHQGLPKYSLTKEENSLMHQLIGHKYGYTDMFNVPLIVHSPGAELPDVMELTGGQVDILPTIVNLLGVSLQQQLHFGVDLYNRNDNLIPFRHFLPMGSFLNTSNLYVTGNAYSDGTNYSLYSHEVTQSGSTEEQFKAAQRLLQLSHSYLQQLPDRSKE